MAYRDLREWLDLTAGQGELKSINGVDWNLEMAGLAELACRESKGPAPAVLFDEIKGYPKGFRALFNQLASPKRLCLTLGLPPSDGGKLDLVRACLEKIHNLTPVAPTTVESGPVLENVESGDQVDILKFPVPQQHELDGGRYIGTGHAVITKDPETGWVNLGTYRCMVFGRDTFGLHISPGRHGRIMRDDFYFARGQPMKVAIMIGADPVLWLASFNEVPWGISEYDYAGGLKGKPIELIEGPYTKLPIPAFAEIAIEGECYPGELQPEGPFGEWAGYYANCGLKPVPEPVVHVKTVLHRNNPILTCSHPAKPPQDVGLVQSVFRSATMWDELEKAGIPGIQGVWMHEVGGGRLFNVVAIRQLYPGHARQVGLMASQCRTGVYVGRYTVVVDGDIDPTDLGDVVWAIATRTDPERSIEITRRGRSSSADPAISPDKKEKGHNPTDTFTSKAVIDACWPYEWKDRAYPVAQLSQDLRNTLIQKWGDQVFD
ncbi:MAG: UbiD family decarboxylase [Candidatus Binatia bacterium]